MNVIEVEGDLLDQPVQVIVNAWNRKAFPVVAAAAAGCFRGDQAEGGDAAVSGAEKIRPYSAGRSGDDGGGEAVV